MTNGSNKELKDCNQQLRDEKIADSKQKKKTGNKGKKFAQSDRKSGIEIMVIRKFMWSRIRRVYI